MDQTIDIARSVLADPPADIKELLNDPRVPVDVQQALKEDKMERESTSTSTTERESSKRNGTSDGNAVEQGKKGENGGKGEKVAGKAGKSSSLGGKDEGKHTQVNQMGDGRLQVVDENQNFTSELSGSLKKWGLLDKGFGYDVVAVFGSQSTGKSTLLNRLFGTTFEVMDESQRRQTTRGIWMSPSAYSSTLVMDVEGTDGRERGEDQDFERKSALFSLASTEVLLVNLWEHQIGLYQGANMGLLKTVFEVNLGLFGGSATGQGSGSSSPSRSHEKTLLLFVIRDHVGATPMKNLTATLTQDMERIWDSLSKPEHLASTTIYDYFDLSFAALPHKVLMPEKFEIEVKELRKRFIDPKREDYVFKPVYHKRIPADGVGFYMEGIWEQVLTNKDLDLPTQQELLAQFRCDEIAAVVLEAFMASLKAVKRPVESGSVVHDLGGMMQDWRSTALAKFDKDASRYHSGVYARKRTELQKSIDTALSPLFLGQLKNLHKQSVSHFRDQVISGIKAENYDFGVVVRDARKNVVNEFTTQAQEVLLKDTDWQYNDELDLLNEDINLIGDQLRADETKKMVNAIERSIRKQLVDPVEVALAKPGPEMWDNVMKAFKTILAQAEATYTKKAKSFNCTAEENTRSLDVLQRRAWQALRRKIDEQLSDPAILAKLRTSFEERFRYDAAGIPRVWKPDDDIDSAFKKAKDETLALIPLYGKITVTDPELETTLPPNNEGADTSLDPDGEFDFPDTLTVFSETKKLDTENRFRRDADAYYVEAKRSMVSSIATIPVWIYGVMVVLGWNEFMVVLFNPLYFAMLLVMGATAYIILQLGLAGPILQITRTVFNEARAIGTEKLRQAFADQQPVREQSYELRPITKSSVSDSNESTKRPHQDLMEE